MVHILFLTDSWNLTPEKYTPYTVKSILNKNTVNCNEVYLD